MNLRAILRRYRILRACSYSRLASIKRAAFRRDLVITIPDRKITRLRRRG